MNYNTTETKKQEVIFERLSDKSSTGREYPWREKKMMNEKLTPAYEKVDERKAERLAECACILLYNLNDDGTKKLKNMNSCRVRLCPICGWRRSLKTYHNVSAIMEALKKEKEYGYIFLTLTVPNCTGKELKENIDEMMDGWQRLMQSKAVANVAKGWYRALEINHDVEPIITEYMYKGKGMKCPKKRRERREYYDQQGLKIGDVNPNYDMYHPHFHCIIVVDQWYFKNDDYLRQDEWQGFWERSMRKELCIVNVKRIKGNTAKAVTEAAKYTVKDNEYITKDFELTVKTVGVLDKALHKRKLIAFGGKFKELHKKLNLDDETDGDLVNVGEGEPLTDEEKREIAFVWHTGYKDYGRVI
jgi:plasmid rolling circle replication initiator protein Rep